LFSFQDNGTTLSFGLNTTTGYTELDVPITASSYTDGKWHHISAVYDGSTKKIYKDGIPYSTTENKTGNVTVSSNVGCIGASPSGSTVCNAESFNGSIDNVSIYNYARTPAQIAWDYNRGAPVAWYKMDECEGATIRSNNNPYNSTLDGALNIGPSGTQTSAGTCSLGLGSSTAWGIGATGKINSSLSFDGNDDWVNVPNNALTNITDQITLSAWVKTSTNDVSVISKRDNANPWNGYILAIGANGGANNGKISYWPGNYPTYAWQYSNSTIVADGNWHHIVVTHSGTTATFYLDGKSDVTRTVGDRTNNSTNDLRISQEIDNIRTFNGLIDDVQIYNYALTAQQVKTLYSGGSVNFR